MYLNICLLETDVNEFFANYYYFSCNQRNILINVNNVSSSVGFVPCFLCESGWCCDVDVNAAVDDDDDDDDECHILCKIHKS